MNVSALIRDATAAGLTLAATERGTLKVNGDDAVVAKWVPTLKAHKPEILAVLKAANDTASRFDAETITEAHEERAAILEYDTGLEREQAEHEAWRILLRDGTLMTVFYDPPKTRADVLAAVADLQDLEPLPEEPRQAGELSRQDEAHLRAWLALIGETDEAMICAVLEQCRADSAALQYYLRLASGKA